MTFKEAVSKLRAMNIQHSCVKYEYCFDIGGIEHDECGVYTARYGGMWAYGKTWEAAFTILEDRIAGYESKPPTMEGAP